MKRQIVSEEEWLKAREAFLQKEKAFTKAREQLTQERMSLPWLKIEKEYSLVDNTGNVTLSDLFDGRSQLIVYHFMFAPEWKQGCMGCSFLADHYNPAIVHLEQRDVSMVTVSRAPIEKIDAFKRRMAWNFRWVSSLDSDFNRDFKVSFTPTETKSGLKIYNYDTEPCTMSDAPGLSSFVKDENGDIYLTYATYARGLEIFLSTYHLLDVVAKGRNEESGMSWVRHHDLYQAETFSPPWVENPENSVRDS